MPQVKRLKIRAPLAVPWEHLAWTFPALEELTFLYDQDFAINSMEVMDESHDLSDDEQLLELHTAESYRDAVGFARDLHVRGFRRLAKQSEKLQEIRLAVSDTSFGYDTSANEDWLEICWRRNSSGVGPLFRRDDALNNGTRATLEARARLGEDAAVEDWGDGHLRFTEEQAAAAGSAVMLQVVRLFDDPSLEAQFGLTPS
mmetsp:Transcript_37696/g.108650  ORF Transcript_37696/g.108650 Transcript_37696/m.108650 type:complete len:201 (-) Transcript_37696:307-909(-)